MGKHTILRSILYDLNVAPYYTILSDEVTSHNVEHLAICARFVNKNKNSREDTVLFGVGKDHWQKDCRIHCGVPEREQYTCDQYRWSHCILHMHYTGSNASCQSIPSVNDCLAQ